MSLSAASARLSLSGTPAIELVKRLEPTKGDVVLATLPIASAQLDHRNFILGTWIRSYKPQARHHGIGVMYDLYEPKIAESRWEDCYVLTDDEGFTVHAWVCGYEGKLWHCYVVPELRRMRIATRLIEFACGKLEEYARPWPYSAHARVNPYLLRTKEPK